MDQKKQTKQTSPAPPAQAARQNARAGRLEHESPALFAHAEGRCQSEAPGQSEPHRQQENRSLLKHRLTNAGILLFWLLVWQALAMALGSPLILATPIQVLRRLAALLPESDFWRSILGTLLRISIGFIAGLLPATLLAVLSARYRLLRRFLAPLMLSIRSIPVASFIIIALIWFSSRYLSAFITFLMVLPILYNNLLAGLDATDRSLLEVADIYRISPLARLRRIYAPSIYPYFRAACSLAIGLSWKAGVAAEVIGMPPLSIGEKLQQAKIYLDTPDLLAWTLVIVSLSLGFEKLSLRLLDRFMRQLRRNEVPSPSSAPSPHALGETPPPDRAPAIRVRNLAKSYGNNHVLTDLNFDLDATVHYALSGPSGRGKTTLLRLLSGLEKPDRGRIRLSKPSQVAVVFQENRLIPGIDAYSNIRLACPHAADALILNSLRELGLADHAQGKDASELSGGMARRVALLRALLSDAGFLLLDEPFTGLDSATKKQAIDLTQRLCRNRTVLLITHDQADARAMGCELIHMLT